MASIYRCRAYWSGFTGQPGITNFYFRNAPHMALVKAFFEAAKPNLPTTTKIDYLASGDVLDDSTGRITGGWTDTQQTTTTGTGTGSYIAAGGYGLRLVTGAVVNGRHVVGRVFLVPGAGATTTGIPTSTENSTTAAAGAAILSGTSDWVVWSRPAPGRSGTSNTVTSVIALPYYVVLRSRRD
jgi:hypothetical protein